MYENVQGFLKDETLGLLMISWFYIYFSHLADFHIIFSKDARNNGCTFVEHFGWTEWPRQRQRLNSKERNYIEALQEISKKVNFLAKNKCGLGIIPLIASLCQHWKKLKLNFLTVE